MDYAKESVKKHAEWKGKIEVIATVPVKSKDDLSLAYTPGVALARLPVIVQLRSLPPVTYTVPPGCVVEKFCPCR